MLTNENRKIDYACCWGVDTIKIRLKIHIDIGVIGIVIGIVGDVDVVIVIRRT